MQKILVAADVEGHFDFLVDKINAFIAKGDHFDLILCVGRTLSHNFDMRRFQNTEKPLIPVPLYFIECGEFSSVLSTLYPQGKEIATNLHYLGHCGFKIINGLHIAFLSGLLNNKYAEVEDSTTYFGPFYSQKDLATIYAQKSAAIGDTNNGIDVLLTSEWPLGFDMELNNHHRAPEVKHISRTVAELTKNIKPRYHFVGLEHIYYQRPPYLNSKDMHITRLIGVGKMPKDSSHPIKEQYLYGCKLMPMVQMNKEELLAHSADMTLNPFKTVRLERQRSGEKRPVRRESMEMEGNIGDNDGDDAETERKPEVLTENITLHFYGFDRRTSDIDIVDFLTRWGELDKYYLMYDHKSKHKGSGFVHYKNIKSTQNALNDSGKFALHGRKINFKQANQNGTGAKSIADCWFCLSNANADRELVINMGSDVYVALDKGPITPRHVLIIPIDHYSSSLQLPIKTRDEIQSIKKNLLKCFNHEYDEILICYERFIRVAEKVSHMHIQVIPFKKDKLKQGLEYLSSALKGSGFKFYEMDENDKITDVVEEEETFFYLEVLSTDALEKKGHIYERRYIYPMNEKEERRFNREIGRELVCAMLELPDRVSWRKCVLSDADTNRAAVELRGKLKKELG